MLPNRSIFFIFEKYLLTNNTIRHIVLYINKKGDDCLTYQLTAPLLDACVLGIVAKEDSYGYTLTQKVQEKVDISESTLYPVLRRLQKEEFLITYDQPYQGRNRRYYRITEAGRKQLEYYRQEWKDYKDRIDGLLEYEFLEGETHDE